MRTIGAIVRLLLLPLWVGVGSFLPVQAAPQVRLLIPVRDGLEFAKIGRWVVDARVYQEGEQVFVLVGGVTMPGRLTAWVQPCNSA